MPEHLLTVEDLLPNGDGTYQMRKAAEISEEELQRKHNYTCVAKQLSQDKLNLCLFVQLKKSLFSLFFFKSSKLFIRFF